MHTFNALNFDRYATPTSMPALTKSSISASKKILGFAKSVRESCPTHVISGRLLCAKVLNEGWELYYTSVLTGWLVGLFSICVRTDKTHVIYQRFESLLHYCSWKIMAQLATSRHVFYARHLHLSTCRIATESLSPTGKVRKTGLWQFAARSSSSAPS